MDKPRNNFYENFETLEIWYLPLNRVAIIIKAGFRSVSKMVAIR